MEEENSKSFEKAIISTLAFFDIFDYPLTAWEIYKFLYQVQAEYFVVLTTISQLADAGKIERRHGFYFFPGKGDAVRIRAERYSIAEEKYQLAIRAVRWLRHIPGVKSVSVCNNLAYSNARRDSDIDLFIITAKDRIWSTRLLVTLAVQLLGIRRHRQKIASRICLSFYIAEDGFNLEPITLKPADPYFYYWLATLTPIYGQAVHQNFILANKSVIGNLPNADFKITGHRRISFDNKISQFIKNIGKFLAKTGLGQKFEHLARAMQLQKMSGNSSSVSSQPDSRVVISDTMLKFHERDRREEYRELWLKKINSFNNL